VKRLLSFVLYQIVPHFVDRDMWGSGFAWLCVCVCVVCVCCSLVPRPNNPSVDHFQYSQYFSILCGEGGSGDLVWG